MTPEPGSQPRTPSAAVPSTLENPLFARYVKTLALLCECHPYIDDPDFEQSIADVLRDASASYPLEVRFLDGRYELALAPGADPRSDPTCAS